MKSINKSAILTGCKMMIAAGCAWWISQRLPWSYNFWSVVTVAAVTRPGLTNTVNKVLARVVGTVIGGLIAYGIAVYFSQNVFMLATCFFIAIGFSGYVALQKSILNYTGIVIGLTLTIVLATTLMVGEPGVVTLYRMLDVLIGIASITLVNICLRIIFPKQEAVLAGLRQQWQQAYEQFIQWHQHKKLVWVSLGIATAATLTFLPWLYWRYTGGFWATISCLFIMEASLVEVKRKSWQRLFIHVLAAAVGAMCAIVFMDYNAWLIIPLLISLFFCGYLMVSSETYSNSGNTLGIALTIMLLGGTPDHPAISMVMARFINVVFGIAVGLWISFLVCGEQR